MSVNSSNRQQLQQAYKGPSANPKGTSPLNNKGTQPLNSASTSKTQQISKKIENGHERVKSAHDKYERGRSLYETGKEAYEAMQEGRFQEYARDKAAETAKQIAYNQTVGRTPIGSAVNAANSAKDAISNLKAGNYKDAVNSAKDAAESATETVTTTKALMETKTAQKTVSKVMNTTAGKVATKAAETAVVKTVAKTTAKAAARFVPGANVAMAAADAHHAYKTLKDPKASAWQKGTAVVTAIGSAAAATNIPIVSQVGAAVATVASIAESINPKNLFSAVKGWFK